MAYLLGWKDILRPIRDGYRHLFPSPDTGPTPEERRKQRAADRLKGFTYFDTFEQLEAWTESDADPLQRANTPLLMRSIAQQELPAKANVLLCHDYAGNYHDYEGASCVGLKEEMYACEYLQYVDTFIYFSHKLVCVPPPAWTNTLHRNGVRVLGTILIEPQTPGSETLFHHGNDGLSFSLATKLAKICDHYGFDGWLVNIEKSFPAAGWNAQLLTAFLRQLRSEIGAEKQLIWYDALTVSNKVSYQNALTAENLTFAKACGSILTNYCWKEKDAAASVHEALHNDMPLQQIYFGIDVWAQNVTKLSQPRVTYPEYGGGGTNTGVAVAKLAELGLSAGIFAPAWTFEHFPSHGKGLEKTMWVGEDLPKAAVCSCGDCDRRHRPNKLDPVSNFARLASAGSQTFFFTDFSPAFCSHGDKEKNTLFNGHPLHAQLGSQSILPLATESLEPTCGLRHRVEASRGRSQLVIETCNLPLASPSDDADPEHCIQSIPLYKLDMPAGGSLQLRISYRDVSDAAQGTYFYMKIAGKTHRLASPGEHQSDRLIDVLIGASDPMSPTDPRLEEIGVYSRVTCTGFGARLAEIDYICIQPVGSHRSRLSEVTSRDGMLLSNSSLDTLTDVPRLSHSIFDIRRKTYDGNTQYTRLCWSHTPSVQPAQGVPHSAITGSFSYFAIHLDSMFIGRAYAAEHEIPASIVQQSAKRELPVHIKGIGFDGQELASASTTIWL